MNIEDLDITYDTDAIPEVASSRPCLRLVADNDSEELTKLSAT